MDLSYQSCVIIALNKCLVCAGKDLEPLLRGYCPHDRRPFRRVAICRSCGHIQRFPLPSEAEYAQLNADFFGSRWAQQDAQHEADHRRKLKWLEARLRPYMKSGASILDIGAGQGWFLDCANSHSCDYFATEPVAHLKESIEARGGHVIGGELSEDYQAYEGAFDIVVFRHVLEHLLDPSGALRTVRYLLKPTGVVYVAVPNAAMPTLNKGLRTGFIHATHVSYFCEGNLLRLAASVGLGKVGGEVGTGLWALLSRDASTTVSARNYYAQQKAVFRRSARRALVRDIVSFSKSVARSFIGRARGAAGHD